MAVGEWDRRELCPDGSCIGVIGPDGQCKTCGRAAPNWGDERNRGLTPVPPDSPIEAEAAPGDDDDEPGDDEPGDDGDDPGDDPGDEDEVDVDSLPAGPSTDDPEWGERVLCSDDMCIGVVGANGKCKTCGKIGPRASGLGRPVDEEPSAEADAASEPEARSPKPEASR